MMSTGTDTPTRPPQVARSRGWQVTAVALTVAALAAASVTVWIWLRGPVHPATLTSAGVHTVRSRQVTREAPARLVVTIGSGDLTVRPGPAGRVSEQRVLTWTGREPVVTESFARGTLTITARCPSSRQRACGADITLSVPPGAAVQAQLARGDMAVSGLRGPVSLAASSGDLRLSRLSGPLRLRSDSGDIVGEALASAQVDAEDNDGDVSLAFAAVPARVSATSHAGDVSVDVPRRAGGYRVRAATAAGDRAVSVRPDPASTHAIIATSDAGDVAVAYSQS
jgi:Putative adhesin